MGEREHDKTGVGDDGVASRWVILVYGLTAVDIVLQANADIQCKV